MSETEMKKDDPIQELARYVEQNLVPAIEGRRCVDGRYINEEGTIARAGADAGYVLILLNLKKQGKIKLSARECVDVVANGIARMGDGLVFTFHTDEHALEHGEEDVLGCAHWNKAANPPGNVDYQDYGLDPEDVKEATKRMNELFDEGKAKKIVLPGNHGETDIVVVTGVKNTIKPQDGKGKMHFVYDKTRDLAFMQTLVETIKNDVPGLVNEDFVEVADKQTAATLHNIALGKSIYEVDTDRETVEPKLVGKVS